jgi:hypothetical protein
MFPVKYEISFYVLFIINSVFKVLAVHKMSVSVCQRSLTHFNLVPII